MTPDIEEDPNICVIGLGYVGLTLAVALADAGYCVRGVETNQEILDCIERGHAHFSEAGIDQRIKRLTSANQFSAGDHFDVTHNATVYIITVGTPVGDDKRTKLHSIKQVAESVSGILKDGDMVILRSTVRVGVSQKVVKPILDASGKDYDLAFCPERTVEGRAIEELTSLPQVVGGINARSRLRASRLFHMLTPSVVRVGSLEAAEMIKLVNNTHRDIMFAFANEIALACEAAGLSASEVIRAANLGYPRGGVKLPGPVGGPCLEKDPYILAEGLNLHGFSPELSLAGRRLNEELPFQVVKKVGKLADQIGLSVRKIAVLGLAFKGRPETSDLRGTLAKPLIESLRENYPDAQLAGWDPVADKSQCEQLFGFPLSSSISEVLDQSDIVIIQTNHVSFEALDFELASRLMSENGIIYDLWAMNENQNLPLSRGVVYASYGSAAILRNT